MLIVCCDSEWDNLTGMVMTREKKLWTTLLISSVWLSLKFVVARKVVHSSLEYVARLQHEVVSVGIW
jgi:hypothetical protein